MLNKIKKNKKKFFINKFKFIKNNRFSKLDA